MKREATCSRRAEGKEKTKHRLAVTAVLVFGLKGLMNPESEQHKNKHGKLQTLQQFFFIHFILLASKTESSLLSQPRARSDGRFVSESNLCQKGFLLHEARLHSNVRQMLEIFCCTIFALNYQSIGPSKTSFPVGVP
jgi:hypothetical protein